MPATVPQSQSNLLAYFQTGDHPSEVQFEEFIRTMFYLTQQAKDAADAATAAADDATAAAALAPKAFGKFSITDALGNNATIHRQVGCTIAKTAQKEITVTLTTPGVDNKYTLLHLLSSAGSATVSVTIARNTNTVVFTFVPGTGGTAIGTIDFVILNS